MTATSSRRSRSPASMTPMMRQYWELKQAHPDTLLFYRMGDFYELFFDDAVEAAPALDIALTKRGQLDGKDVPMCGVPVHNAESYLHRLIRKGYRVAVCEQVEDPADARKRGSGALVKRDVVRIVTPGTLTEDGLLESRRNNFLAAVARSRGRHALAWLDISTGAFWTQSIDADALGSVLARIGPGEVLVSESLPDDASLRRQLDDWADRLTRLPSLRFESTAGERRLGELLGVTALDAFGAFERAEIGAAGALLDYVDLTQKGRIPRIAPPRRVEPGSVMAIDAATRRNLELLASLAGERKGSLLATIDRTVTGAGGRLLTDRLAAPLAEPSAIRRRHDQVEALVDDPPLREDLRSALRACPDLERALSRLSVGRGGPRDLAAIRAGLEKSGAIKERLTALDTALNPIAAAIADLDALVDGLAKALADDLPLQARDGGFVRPGHDPELDELRTLRDESRRHIAALEARYREMCGVPTIKIRHNNLIGYYVEVAAGKLDKVPDGFVQRQSMANATRFTTAELGDLESRIASASERALAVELRLFDRLVQTVLDEADAISRTAGAVARIDVAAGLADLAEARGYCRPQISEGTEFIVEGGRHPVVEDALLAGSQPFVANDADLTGDRRLWLLTGPNMAGKSTFLRQNALIAILAQAGSFVPAARTEIGIIDRLFSRVGAADDLARGRSTFMVEMVETAAILNQATEKSLVILDEIGRGTATYDGLSIAWAVVEHLHEVNRCRGLFATHYHELTVLSARLDRLSCHTMLVKEWKGEVVFLHEVAEGTADRSYGIHVARLAGLPLAVTERAGEVLKRLEQGEAQSAPAQLADDLPLFAVAAGTPASGVDPERLSRVEEELRAVNPDELSPRDALELIYALKSKLADDA